MNLNDKMVELARAFTLHMLYEYPQIDPATRENLAGELAILAVFE